MMTSNPNDKKNEKSSTNKLGAGIALGVGVGLAIGTAIGNPGAGLAIGIAFGVGIGATLQKKKNAEQDDDQCRTGKALDEAIKEKNNQIRHYRASYGYVNGRFHQLFWWQRNGR